MQSKTTDQVRLRKWRELRDESLVPLDERLPPGKNLPWPLWKNINRLRAGEAKTRVKMVKWRYKEEPDTFECNES